MPDAPQVGRRRRGVVDGRAEPGALDADVGIEAQLVGATQDLAVEAGQAESRPLCARAASESAWATTASAIASNQAARSARVAATTAGAAAAAAATTRHTSWGGLTHDGRGVDDGGHIRDPSTMR